MSPSTRRAALAACAALLLVTAGCSGVTTTDDAPTTDRAPATTTTTPTSTWSPNASVEQYPPGVADNGTLANASALVDAHFEATANQSTEFTVEWTVGNDSFARSLVTGPTPTSYYSTDSRTVDGSQVTEEFYGTGSRGYSRVAFANETRYSALQNTDPRVAAWTKDSLLGPRDALRAWLSSGNYTVNGTVERAGRTFVRLTADELATDSGFATRYEGTALVTPDGVVHDVDASANRTTGEATEERVDVSITVDADAEWTGPPSWMADIPQLSLSIVEDGHAVEIRNTGGAALPANTSLDIYALSEPARVAAHAYLRRDANATVTTDARLEPGDAVYVTAGADGTRSSYALHDEPTRGEYTFGFAGLRGQTGNVRYRLATGFEPYVTE